MSCVQYEVQWFCYYRVKCGKFMEEEGLKPSRTMYIFVYEMCSKKYTHFSRWGYSDRKVDKLSIAFEKNAGVCALRSIRSVLRAWWVRGAYEFGRVMYH